MRPSGLLFLMEMSVVFVGPYVYIKYNDAEGENRTPYASLFQGSGLSHHPKKCFLGAGRLCRIIVGTHPLVSTPFPILEPIGIWLGIVSSFLKSFPEFTQFFS